MTSDILRRLAEPFDPSIVSFRVGPTTKDKSKGMALAYIDARDVMNRLDAVMGPANWQNDYPWSDGKRVVCRIGVKLGDEWIWKADGAGDTDTEGEKGALSDAFKRSAVHWGVGRYLYDCEAPWVQIEQKGGSYVIAPAELPKLRARLPRPAVPNVKGEPVRSPAPRSAPDTDDPKVRAEAAAKIMRDSIESLRTPDRLERLIANNASTLERIKDADPAAYDDLMTLATARKTEMLSAA